MYFKSQEEYVAYHSPAQRAIRAEAARQQSEAIVREAYDAFRSGDQESAREILIDSGITPEGAAHYISSWK